MFLRKTVAVVIPVYNEEKLVGHVLETIPGYVDHIIVVDDHSTDNTVNIVRGSKKNRSHVPQKNRRCCCPCL